MELCLDKEEIIRRVTATDVSAAEMGYNLHMTTRQWLETIEYNLKWSKVDSHINQTLQINPTKVLNRNRFVLRLNKKVDKYTGDMCAAMNQPGKIFLYPASVVMATINGTWIYGYFYQQLTDSIHSAPLPTLFV